jgi:ATP-dependent DNA helicase RecG
MVPMTSLNLTDAELEVLLRDLESDLVERKQSLSEDSATKVRQAICALANDLPDSGWTRTGCTAS